MSFEPIKMTRSGNIDRTSPKSVYFAVYGSRRHNRPHHAAIRIGADIAAELGWAADMRVAILEGKDASAGTLKLVLAQPGQPGLRLLPTNTKASNGDLMLLPSVNAFVHHTFAGLSLAEPVPSTVGIDELTLRLPGHVIRKGFQRPRMEGKGPIWPSELPGLSLSDNGPMHAA